MKLCTVAAAALSAALTAAPVSAELVSLEITKREPFADGKAFGDTGPYERLIGTARFAVDPKHPANALIIDLDKAPRNAAGKVEFESDVFILAPKDPAKGNGAVLYDVNNRGNKLAVRFFNITGGGNDPKTAADAGDGFLFRRGYTVVWCGWIGELLPGNNRLRLHIPAATDDGKPIRGIVRYEMGTDVPAETLPLSRREAHGTYVPTEKGLAEGVLTWRFRETDPRVVIPRGQWSIAVVPAESVDSLATATKSNGLVQLPQVRLKVAGGFRPGCIYELIAQAQGPLVHGLSFATVRDLVGFLKHDGSARNPLAAGGKSAINRAHGFGISQSGRFLRNLLYLNFNADEAGRKVFDGLIPHVAGGGLGFFNHRFAQPTRHNGQHEDHSYPADYFPFTYGESTDPFTGKTDSIQRRTAAADPKLLPKVMHTQSSAEYWHRAGSLVHTDPLGKADAVIPDNVRIYAFGGTQHGPAADPPERSFGDHRNNPGDFRPIMKALLDALDEWVRTGREPPAGAYPKISDKTLVAWDQASTGFPGLPGVRYPDVIQRPPCRDLGPDFESKGIISIEPPKYRGEYTVLVFAAAPDGNDRSALVPAEVGVPVATFTGWNLRRRDVGAEGALANLLGSYIPFAQTKAERAATGDPRPSLEERYGSFEEYRRRFAERCARMVLARVMLQEDADRLIRDCEKRRALFAAAGK